MYLNVNMHTDIHRWTPRFKHFPLEHPTGLFWAVLGGKPSPQNYSSLLEVASALVKQYLYLQKSVLVLCLSEVSRNSHSHKMRKPQRKEFKFNPKITSSKFLKMPVRFYRQELLLGNTP